MEVLTKDIYLKNSDDKFTLWPIGDTHLGSPSCHERKLREALEEISKTKNGYMLGMGDYSDLILRQDLKRFSGGVVKGELQDFLDSLLNEQTREVKKVFEPLAKKNKILGMSSGNHEDSIKKHHSYDIMREVCSYLNVPNLGDAFFYRLNLRCSTVVRTIVIMGHHGYAGGARKPGASLNQLHDLISSFDADIYIMGHDHRRLAERHMRLSVPRSGSGKVIEQPILLVRSGTFMRTYTQGFSGYGEKKAYPPTEIGTVKIEIQLKGKNNLPKFTVVQ